MKTVENLPVNFHHAFKLPIWRVLTDDVEDLLVVELRDKKERKTYFSVIDLLKHKLLWTDKSFDDPWWISMGAAHKGKVVFFYYEDEKQPTQRGFFVYDIFQQTKLWENHEYAYYTLLKEEDALVVFKRGELLPKYSALNLHTGKPQSINNPKQGIRRLFEQMAVSPLQYNEHHPHFDTLAQFVQIFSKENYPQKVIDYIELDDWHILGYYLKNGNYFDYYLLVSDNEGTPYLHFMLDSKLRNTYADLFFVLKNELIVIKNRTELISFQLEKEES
jgi:hypothetical protein